MAQRAHVIVVGAGFGGLAAARALRRVPVRVTVVDRHNYHLFQPLLYQVASGLLDPSEIAHPVRTVLRRARNVDVRMAEVTAIDADQRVVLTSNGRLPYDFLVIAIGSVNNYFGLDHVEREAYGLKDLQQALRLREQVLGAFEAASICADAAERRRILAFAVVGGGPTGVEYSGAVAELITHVLPKDFPNLDFSEVSVTLVEGADRLLGTFAPRLGLRAAKVLERKGVSVRLGRTVRDFDGRELLLDNGERQAAQTVVWTAGVRAAAPALMLGEPAASLGRVAVSASLHLPGRPEVFVIGDAAQVEQGGAPLPMLAPVAIQQGKHVARVIAARQKHRPDPAFRYRDKGTMATIGRGSAVAQLGPIHVNGFLGWLMWLGLHIVYIIGFRSRVVVLITWAWNFFFYDRPVRLIVNPPDAGMRHGDGTAASGR